MEKLYFLIAQCETWVKNDPNGYLYNYFIQEGAFLHAFLIALAVAALAAAIFYGWIGNAVAKLSNLPTWLCTTLLGAVVTFLATKMLVVGSNLAQTGIFQSIIEHKEELLKAIPPEDEVGRNNLISQTGKLVNTINDGCDVTNYLYLGNVVLVVLLFFIISLLVKKWTKFAVYVPF